MVYEEGATQLMPKVLCSPEPRENLTTTPTAKQPDAYVIKTPYQGGIQEADRAGYMVTFRKIAGKV